MAREGLTEKQRAFVQEYLVDLNATQAAIRAGYGAANAHKVGSELLGKTGVRAAVDAALAARAERVEVTADVVLRELLLIAKTDLGELYDDDTGALKPLKDIPPHLRRVIASIETEELYEGFGEDRLRVGVTRKVKLWDKTKSLELLGKHLKLFTDKVEHSGALTLEQLVAESMKPKGDK